MRTQQGPKQDSTFAVVPDVSPKMFWRVAHVQALENFRLRVTFLDGLSGEVDMSCRVHSAVAGVFSALLDPACFSAVFLEYGVVTWPVGCDLAPDAMYKEIKQNGFWKLE